MAKPIAVVLDQVESSFDHSKLDRAKLYGARKRVPLDMEGVPCVRSSLTTDGLYLLQPGMTAQGYFDETGRWLQKSQLVGIGADGEPLETRPSTLGVPQLLEPVKPEVVLDYSVDAVYVLEPIDLAANLRDRLDAGEIFRFAFNYVADYQPETAFLLKNAEAYFCLVGAPYVAVWSEPGKVSLAEADEGSDDDLDFDMF